MRRNIDEINFLRRARSRFSLDARFEKRPLEPPLLVARLPACVILYFSSSNASNQTISFVTLPSTTFAYGASKKSEIVHARETRQIVDETDVRAFRALDRTDPSVVRTVHVAHLEARPFARETAGTQG